MSNELMVIEQLRQQIGETKDRVEKKRKLLIEKLKKELEEWQKQEEQLDKQLGVEETHVKVERQEDEDEDEEKHKQIFEKMKRDVKADIIKDTTKQKIAKKS